MHSLSPGVPNAGIRAANCFIFRTILSIHIYISPASLFMVTSYICAEIKNFLTKLC